MEINLETNEILKVVVDGTCEFNICGERNNEGTMILNTSAKEEPKVVILDDNPISIAKYSEEYPENWKAICNALDKDNDVKSKETVAEEEQ